MSFPMESEAKIAVLIPCHNEAGTIGKVIDDFRAALPEAQVFVFDNCSTDDSAAIARSHGAKVLAEPRKGKGFVVEGMLDRVRADYYVMVDGDDTYPAQKVGELLAPVMSGDADMAVGARLRQYQKDSFRPLHVAGNTLIRGLINKIFRVKLTDIFSGYRAFGRKVVERIPVVSAGFEVETELTVHMLYYKLTIVEVQVPYRARPAGSKSKLNTFRDGARVLWKLFNLIRAFKPLTFFGGLGIVLLVLGLLAGAPPVYGFIESGYQQVERFPLAILATGLILLSAGSVFLGLILHAMNWRFKELHNVMVRRKGHSRRV
ncbi:MAG: glycosyltransferase [Phycisphaerae bacterium]|nr:glycosyltransferase [Phycisphaerae bacterium]